MKSKFGNAPIDMVKPGGMFMIQALDDPVFLALNQTFAHGSNGDRTFNQ
jgi:hypothetical protein